MTEQDRREAADRVALSLNTDLVPPRERLDFWQDRMDQIVCPVTLVPQDGSPSASMSVDRIGPVGLAEFTCANFSLSRTSHDIARGTKDAIYVFQQLGTVGSYATVAKRNTFELSAGDLLIADLDETIDSSSDRKFWHQVWLFPRSIFHPAAIPAGSIEGGLHLRQGQPIANILTAYLSELQSNLSRLDVASAERFALNAGLLTAAAAGCGRNEEVDLAIEAGKLAFINARIEEQLCDPLLSPERIARSCGLSVRRLHQLFEPTGLSLSRYVMQRRMVRARAALAIAHPARSIADLAYDLGFNSLGTFYRAYQSQYNETPGDTRERTAGGFLR